MFITVVIIQTMNENNKITEDLYRLIQIGFHETAEDLTEALLQNLKSDGIYDVVKLNMVAFISDGIA